MYLNYYIYLIMFIFSLFLMSYFYSQILLTLLSMEFLMLSVLMILSNMFMIMNSMFILMYYLVFVVCESVLGLTILVYMIRNKGNDNMSFLNLILW